MAPGVLAVAPRCIVPSPMLTFTLRDLPPSPVVPMPSRPNLRVRNRTHGGVGGVELPLPPIPIGVFFECPADSYSAVKEKFASTPPSAITVTFISFVPRRSCQASTT